MPVRFGRALVPLAVVVCAVPALAAAPDSQFAMQAAQGGMAEVRMARLALSKTQNPVVRTFAQRMIADHTPNNAQLAMIMRSEGMTVPTTLDPNSQAMMARLQGLSGRTFDRGYMAGQVRAHQQMQILMQNEVNGGKDARLKGYAKTTLSAVNMHLNLAKTDVKQLGGAMAGSMPGMSGGSMSGGMSGGSSSGGSMSGGSSSGGTTSGAPGSMNASPMPASSMAPGGSGSSMGGSMPRPSASGSPNGMNGTSPMAPSPRPSGMPRTSI